MYLIIFQLIPNPNPNPITIMANGKTIEWLIDTGSEVNLINQANFDEVHVKMTDTDMTMVGGNGRGFKCIGEAYINFRYSSHFKKDIQTYVMKEGVNCIGLSLAKQLEIIDKEFPGGAAANIETTKNTKRCNMINNTNALSVGAMIVYDGFISQRPTSWLHATFVDHDGLDDITERMSKGETIVSKKWLAKIEDPKSEYSITDFSTSRGAIVDMVHFSERCKESGISIKNEAEGRKVIKYKRQVVFGMGLLASAIFTLISGGVIL